MRHRKRVLGALALQSLNRAGECEDPFDDGPGLDLEAGLGLRVRGIGRL